MKIVLVPTKEEKHAISLSSFLSLHLHTIIVLQKYSAARELLVLYYPFFAIANHFNILSQSLVVIPKIILLFIFRLNELEDFASLSFQPSQSKHCDVVVKKPTIFMKLDAGLSSLSFTVIAF